MAKAPTIDPKTTWVTSDSHFGHQNIIGFCHRPTDHEQVIMEEWAQTVPTTDTLLHLGDLSYKNNGMFKHVIAKHLTGNRKLLIKGNHDHGRPSFYRESDFKVIPAFEMPYDPNPEFGADVSKRYIVSFAHYPLRTLNKTENTKKRVHIHGHIHNNGYGGKEAPFIPFAAGQINVSVEQTHYRPVNLDVLLKGFILGAYETKEDGWSFGEKPL